MVIPGRRRVKGREAVLPDDDRVGAQGRARADQHRLQVGVEVAGRRSAVPGVRRGGVHPARGHDVVDLAVDREGLVEDGVGRGAVIGHAAGKTRGNAADGVLNGAVTAVEAGVVSLRYPLGDRERHVPDRVGGDGGAVVLLYGLTRVGTGQDRLVVTGRNPDDAEGRLPEGEGAGPGLREVQVDIEVAGAAGGVAVRVVVVTSRGDEIIRSRVHAAAGVEILQVLDGEGVDVGESGRAGGGAAHGVLRERNVNQGAAGVHGRAARRAGDVDAARPRRGG